MRSKRCNFMPHTITILYFIIILSLLINFSIIATYAENSDRDYHVIKNPYVDNNNNNNNNNNYLEDLAIEDWISLSFHLSLIYQ